MFSCLRCLFPWSWSALIWCVRCLNIDLTVLYTKTSTTVPYNRGILGALRNQNPAVWKIHSRNSAVFLDYVVPKIPRSNSVVLVFVYNTVYNFCSTSFCVQYCVQFLRPWDLGDWILEHKIPCTVSCYEVRGVDLCDNWQSRMETRTHGITKAPIFDWLCYVISGIWWQLRCVSFSVFTRILWTKSENRWRNHLPVQRKVNWIMPQSRWYHADRWS